METNKKNIFESIFYDTDNKEVVIMLGYGIGNHLSLKFLREITRSILTIFPLSDKILDELPFNPVSDSSTRHKYCWYTRIANFDLTDEWMSQIGKKSGTFFYHKQEVFAITAHKRGVDGWVGEDEETKACMNRMIHG